MSQLTTLESLYIEALKDLYSAEHQLIKALPKMAKAANSETLQKAFQTHLKQTQEQASRLERIFEDLPKSPRGKKCVAMEGLIEEGNELIKKDVDPAVLDAGLIAAAQKVEHYEIAAYGTVRTWAELLGRGSDVKLLQKTLDEEGETDKLLTNISRELNMAAEVTGGGSEEEDQHRAKHNGLGNKIRHMFS